MLPYFAVNLPIQPLMEHSFMALVGAAAMVVVAALLVVWTIVFYQSASRSPILTFSGRRQENLCHLLVAYRKRLTALGADPRYLALEANARQVVLGKILGNLSKQYYRTAGWGNYPPQQLLATDWPQLAALVSALPDPEQTPRQGRAPVPAGAAALSTAISQIDYRNWLHAHALKTRQDLVVKPPRRSRFWIVPVTLTVLCLLVVSGLQTHSWALEQQAVRADRQGDPSLAQDLRLHQSSSLLLADRWLVNYNLGTTYLNTGDLHNAHKYLSGASNKMPFILETKMTEPQAVLAACQVNYNLALVTIKTSEEVEATDVLTQASHLLVYCDQKALITRQKYWNLERETTATSRVSASLKRVAKDSDSLIAQIKKQGGSDFRIPEASWLEDFGY